MYLNVNKFYGMHDIENHFHLRKDLDSSQVLLQKHDIIHDFPRIFPFPSVLYFYRHYIQDFFNLITSSFFMLSSKHEESLPEVCFCGISLSGIFHLKYMDFLN